MFRTVFTDSGEHVVPTEPGMSLRQPVNTHFRESQLYAQRQQASLFSRIEKMILILPFLVR